MIQETKICKGACGQELPVSAFYFRKETNTYRIACKKCKSVKTLAQIKDQVNASEKKCKHCEQIKPIEEYQKAGKGKWTQPYCKPCDAARKHNFNKEHSDKVSASRKEYYRENKEEISARQRKAYVINIDKIKDRAKKYRQKNKSRINERDKKYNKKNKNTLAIKSRQRYIANKDIYLAKGKIYRESRSIEQIAAKKKYDKEYRQKNKDRINANKIKTADKIRERNRKYNNNKSATDIAFRILKNLRSRTRFALKKWDTIKSDTTENLLGCSVVFFQEYFSSLFYGGMTWDDFMSGDVHIDHKIPCKDFDLRNEGEQRKCFNYSNLQPLWRDDNLKKGAKLIYIKTA